MKNKKTLFFSVFVVFFLATLACQSGATSPIVPTSLPAIPTLDPNLSEKFEEEWQKSIVDAVTTGSFSVTLTEGQFTDFINRKNVEDPNAGLSNIQVFLRDGQIQIYGATNDDSSSTTVQIIATVSITSEGKLQFTVVSAKLGSFPVPEPILSSLSQSFNDALNGKGTTGTENIQLQSIVIADGYMTITGQLK